MHFRSATKVGIAVLVSVGAFVLIWYFLLGQGLKSHSYPVDFLFKDAQNITTGAAVRMAGVEIGVVQDIGLTTGNLAKLRLSINKKYPIPIGSETIITSGGLIGEKYVSIQPPPGIPATFILPNSTVHGQDTIQLEDLMEKASQIATSSNQVIREARLALADTRQAIQAVSRLASDPALERSIHETLRNVESASRSADRTAAQFQEMTAGVQPNVRKMMASMQKSADNVQELTGSLSGILSGEDIKSNLGATLHNVKIASEKLDAIADNLSKLTGDTQMASDIKEITGNIKTATAETKDAATAINQAVQRLTGRFRRPREPGPGGTGAKGKSPGIQGTVDLLQSADPGRFRADINAILPVGPVQFVYGGFHGIGQENRVNLQLGQTLGNRWDSRYGIHNGKLGVGFDYDLGEPGGWTADLYNPNHLTADLYGRRRLNDDTSLIFGVENLFHHAMPTVGVRIRR